MNVFFARKGLFTLQKLVKKLLHWQHRKILYSYFVGVSSQLFKSFKFGNGSRMSDESLPYHISRTKMVKTNSKKCQNKEDIQNILFRWQIKTRNFPSKIGDIQYLARFLFIHEAPWMQMLYFFSLWRQERSGLSASRTFQPQGG